MVSRRIGQPPYCCYHGGNIAVCFCGGANLVKVPVLSARALPRGDAGMGISGALCSADERLPAAGTATLQILSRRIPAQPGGRDRHAHRLPRSGVRCLVHRLFYAARAGVLCFCLALLEGHSRAVRPAGIVCPGGTSVHVVFHPRVMGHDPHYDLWVPAENHLLPDCAVLPSLPVQRLVYLRCAGVVLSAAEKPQHSGLWKG